MATDYIGGSRHASIRRDVLPCEDDVFHLQFSIRHSQTQVYPPSLLLPSSHRFSLFSPLPFYFLLFMYFLFRAESRGLDTKFPKLYDMFFKETLPYEEATNIMCIEYYYEKVTLILFFFLLLLFFSFFFPDWLFLVWCGVVWCGVVWCGVVWCGCGVGVVW